MSRAQGEYRGPARDAEEQFAGGDGAAMAATSEQARRTVAFKAYRDGLAHLGLHEVWADGKHIGYRAADPDRKGNRVLFQSDLLRSERQEALGY